MIFRRREALHERLAREGGLVQRRPVDTTPRWGEVGIHGVARPREWDAVVTAETDVQGERAEFVALPDGTLVVEDGPEDVRPLAAAVERSLTPPYRAEAVRRDGNAWAVGARQIRVADLGDAEGDEVQLTRGPEGRSLTIDGIPAFGSIPALEQLLDAHGSAAARRIDGSLWEVRVDRL